MFEVLVCEDDILQKALITKYIANVILIENLDMKVAVSTINPSDIIDYVKNNTSTALYFLDVNLNVATDGISLAKKIREYDPRGFIVFITSRSETLYLTFEYKVEAMDFIIKDDWDNVYTKIHDCIIDAHKKYSSKSTELQETFTFQMSDKKLIIVEYDKILYFETSKTSVHKVKIHAIDSIREFYGNLNDIESEISKKHFFRCHKSFIVNLSKIESIDLTENRLFLKHGDSCCASTRKIRKLTKICKCNNVSNTIKSHV